MSNSSSATKRVSKVSKKPCRVFLKPVPNFQTCLRASISVDLENKSSLISRDPFTDHYFKIFMLNPDELIALTESALDFDDLDDSKIFDANCKKLVDLKYVFTELNNYYFRTRKFKLEESVQLLDSDE